MLFVLHVLSDKSRQLAFVTTTYSTICTSCARGSVTGSTGMSVYEVCVQNTNVAGAANPPASENVAQHMFMDDLYGDYL